MDLIYYSTYYWHKQKLKQYLCLEPFSTVIYESSIPANQYFLAFFLSGPVCKLFKSDLEIINLIFDISWYVVSAYITWYFVLSYVEKFISTVGHIFSYFLLANMSWMSYYFRYLNHSKYFRHVQKIKHCLYLKLFNFLIYGKFSYNYFSHFNFFLVSKLYRSSLQILQLILGHLTNLGSVDIAAYLTGALFQRCILTLAHFSDVFFWPVNCGCGVCISFHILGMDKFHLRVFSIDIHKNCKSNHYLLLLVIFHDLRMT